MKAPQRSTTRARGSRASRPASTSRFALGPVVAPEPGRLDRARALPWRRLGLAGGGLVVAAVLAFVAQWLLLGDALRVRDVRLEGVGVTDPFAIAAAADVAGDSLITLDPASVAAAVAAVPGVAAVEVQRDWPRGVVIAVTEREGWGYWQVGPETVVVDSEGERVDVGRAPAAGAPTIVELGAGPLEPDADTVRVVARLLDGGAFDVLRVRPRGFLFRGDRGLTVLTEGGPDAVFGDSHDFDFKVASWGALLDTIEEQGLQVTEIDLRFGKHVVMR